MVVGVVGFVSRTRIGLERRGRPAPSLRVDCVTESRILEMYFEVGTQSHSIQPSFMERRMERPTSETWDIWAPGSLLSTWEKR